jgi:hypothetical protein
LDHTLWRFGSVPANKLLAINNFDELGVAAGRTIVSPRSQTRAQRRQSPATVFISNSYDAAPLGGLRSEWPEMFHQVAASMRSRWGQPFRIFVLEINSAAKF